MLTFSSAASDECKLNSFATKCGSRVSSSLLDVLDPRSLDDFCTRCAIVVNCGGPVTLLQDRVAQAAVRHRCHYLDPAGMSFVKERLLPHNREIADMGLRFVVSAGWTPGITELLPVHAHARARTKMDSIEICERLLLRLRRMVHQCIARRRRPSSPGWTLPARLFPQRRMGPRQNVGCLA